KIGTTYRAFFFSSRRRHTKFSRDWSSDVCSSALFLGSNRTQSPSLLQSSFFPVVLHPDKSSPLQQSPRKLPGNWFQDARKSLHLIEAFLSFPLSGFEKQC